MSAALAFALAALVAALALRVLLRGALASWHDLPNHRSLHAAPVPRIGGLGIHAGWVAALAAAAALGAPAWLGPGAAIGLAAIVAVSLLDDWRSVGALPRLVVQAGAAAALVADTGAEAIAAGAVGQAIAAGGPVMRLAALALVGLAVLWALNLYNFMDGADGLAGGMAVFGFGTYAALGLQAAPGLALTAAALAGAAAGFLTLNFPPARVFMGDAGSVPLGFLAAALGLAGIAQGAWGWWLPPLAFLPFALDATFTLALRALRGERIWQAHREHAYQKLILMGWSHRRCALAWYGAMAVCAAAALGLGKRPAPVQWLGLAALAAAALAVRAAVESAWRRHRRSTGFS